MDPERELYAKVQTFCPFYEAIIKKKPDILTLDGHYFHSRNVEVLGKTRCTTFAFPSVAFIDFNLWEFPFMQPLKTYHAQVLEIWL